MSIGRGLKRRVRAYETNQRLNNAVLGWAKMMHMLEEIKETLWIEIRPNSKGLEYLEGVIYKKDLELLNSLLSPPENPVL